MLSINLWQLWLNGDSMLKSLSDPRYQHFSCFGVCLGGSMVALLGLAFLVMDGFRFDPRWLYLFALFLAVGLTIDLVSKRLLWIRVCQVLAMSLPTISFTAFLLYDLYSSLSMSSSYYIQITSVIVVLAILSTITLAFIQTLWDPNRKILPHGSFGSLDIRLGVVDPEKMPSQVPKKLIETQTRTQAGLRMISRFTPIIAAIAMLSVRAFSSLDMLQILKTLFLIVATIFAYGVGSYSAFFVTIRRWERINQKKIYVKL